MESGSSDEVVQVPSGSPRLEMEVDEDANLLHCIYGCTINENQEVLSLDCLHFICSDDCAAKLIAETKEGSLYTCKLCKRSLGNELPKKKIVPANIFVKKLEVTLICENCTLSGPAVSHCNDCPSFLCKQCTDLHPQMRKTQTHVVTEDLTIMRAEYTEKTNRNASFCFDHKLHFSSYCHSCSEKICEKCETDHIQCSEKDNLEGKRHSLKAWVEKAEIVKDNCERAIVDIDKKVANIKDVEWKHINESIEKYFEEVVTLLATKQAKAIKAAKERILQQLAALNMRKKCAEYAKSSANHLITISNQVLNELDSVAPVMFIKQYEDSTGWLKNISELLVDNYDMFVDNGWHFELDSLDVAEIQKVLDQSCQLKYVCEQENDKGTATGEAVVLAIQEIAISLENTQVEDETCGPQGVSIESNSVPPLDGNQSNSIQDSLVQEIEAIVHSGLPDVVEETRINETSDESHNTTLTDSAEETNQNGECCLDLRATISEKVATSGRCDFQTKPLHKLNMKVASCLGDSRQFEPVDLGSTLKSTETIHEEVDTENGVRINTGGTPLLAQGSSTIETVSSAATIQVFEAGDNKSRQNSRRTKSSLLPSTGLNLRNRKITKRSHPQSVDSNDKMDFCEIVAVLPKRSLVTTEPKSNSNSRQQRSEQQTDQQENIFLKNRAELQQQPVVNYAKSPDLAALNSRVNLKLGMDWATLAEAPFGSIEVLPRKFSSPEHGMRIMDDNAYDARCEICYRDDLGVLYSCSLCPKFFHKECHIPAIKNMNYRKWECNHHTTKKEIEKRIISCPRLEGSENRVLEEKSNDSHFQLACKFVMEFHKVAEANTMKWVFPDGYCEIYKKTPFHLKYIRQRLCLGDPSPFNGVKQMLYAFRQMFIQAFQYYTVKSKKMKEVVWKCWEKFLTLVKEYYPQHQNIFANVLSIIPFTVE